MKKRIMIAAAVGAVLACSLSCAAQDKGYWRAASTETMKMTGDISIADLKVTINFATFPLAPIRRLKPVEVSAVFDADVNAGISGDLYRLRVPANKYIVKRNTLVRRRGHAVDGDLRHGAHDAGGVLLRRRYAGVYVRRDAEVDDAVRDVHVCEIGSGSRCQFVAARLR